MSDEPTRALVTGITGQDGSYLAEHLLSLGYEVHGVVRRASSFNTQRIDHIYQDPHALGGRPRLRLHFGDVTDAGTVSRLVREVRPREIYHLAAQSHVRVSFDLPVYTAQSVALGTLNVLEAARTYGQETGEPVRVLQASSSEQFGKVAEVPQRETTPFHPRSPYACAKVMAHHAAVNWREAYGLFVCCAISFNHESPRRGETFVTRKITRGVGRIKLGLQDALYLGNLDARRDWGFAGDYVRAMHLMLQRDTPDDYVLATGRCVSVREFAQMAFARAGLDAEDFIRIDPRYLRPSEVDLLQGDASKAQRDLGWRAATSLEDLVAMMVDADLELARQEKTLRDAGHEVHPARGVEHRR